MIFPFFLKLRCNLLINRAKRLKSEGCLEDVKVRASLGRVRIAELKFNKNKSWDNRKKYALCLVEAKKSLDNFVNPPQEKLASNSHEDNNFTISASSLFKASKDNLVLPNCFKSPLSPQKCNINNIAKKPHIFHNFVCRF